MAFITLLFTTFIIFLQPTFFFPEFEIYRPLRTIAVIALIFYIFSGGNKERSFLKIKENRYFIAFAFMQVIACSFIWLQYSFEIMNTWLKTGIIYFLIVMLVKNHKRIQCLMLSIISGISFLSYYSISTYMNEHANGNLLYRANGYGWFQGTNDIAMILVCMIPLCFLFFEIHKKNIIKSFFLILILVFSYNIMITGSRNGILGFLVVSLLCIIGSKLLVKPLKIVAICLCVFLMVPVGIMVVKSRTDVSDGSYTADTSAQNRIVQWKAGIKMVIHHPLFGIGPEQFSEVAELYGGEKNLQPHNTLIQVFAETGLIGGIFFLLMNFYAIKDIFHLLRDLKIKQSHEKELIIYKYISFSFIGFWVCAFFSNRNQSYILYVLIALMVATKELLINKNQAQMNIK